MRAAEKSLVLLITDFPLLKTSLALQNNLRPAGVPCGFCGFAPGEVAIFSLCF